MTTRRTLAVCAVAALIATGQASGQGGRRQPPAAMCKVDSAQGWALKQREWLDDSRHTWTNDTLRTGLLRAAGLSQVNRAPLQVGWEVQESATPSLSAEEGSAITQLRSLAATRGATWPTKSVAGALATRAVWLLAHKDTALARAALKRMMEAGPEESNAADVAVLEDRLRLQSGRKQIYGTQFIAGADGALMPAPMEDSTHVDLRREDAGLPAFRVSACLARASVMVRK